MDDARAYMLIRKIKTEQEEAQDSVLSGKNEMLPAEADQQEAIQTAIDELDDENDEITQSYMTKVREYGSGEIRIGECLTLQEDIYSIGFICQIRDDIMKKYLDITTGQAIEEDSDQDEQEQDETTDKPMSTRFGIQSEGEQDDIDEYENILQEQAKIRRFQKEYQIRRSKRLNIFLHVLLCFLCQIFLAGNIFTYLIYDSEQSALFSAQVSIEIMFARFICGTILHLSLLDEVTSGLENMKFALNHPYYFQSPFLAWLVGFLQCTITIMVEVVNMEIILISTDPVNIVYNFIALAIIAEFDDFVYSSLKNESMKKLIEKEVTEKVLIIRHTTSKKCTDTELTEILDDDGNARPLRVCWESRSLSNKVCYCLYKGLRTFYVSFYFYFFPFISVLLTCLLPILYINQLTEPT